jgi:hypothetical protein
MVTTVDVGLLRAVLADGWMLNTVYGDEDAS